MLIFFRPFSASSLRVQPLGGMLSFSFLFLGQEELEYSWPFALAETVVKEVVVRTAVRETTEMGDRSAQEPLCFAVSLMSALRHRTTPCSASPNVFSPSPPTKSS